MLGVRWYKVINDLLSNKTRTALIVLSIAVGLFAIGTIVNARVILSQDLAEGHAAIAPSSGVIRTFQTFDEDVVRSVRQMSGVQEADARTHIIVRFQVRRNGEGSTSRWRDLQLFAVPDYDQMRVNKIRPQAGAWPPPKREILIERSGMELIGAQVGDTVLIELSEHKVRELRIAGTVHDLAQLPSPIDGTPYGYVSFDTLEWLGEPRGLNELHVIARNTHSASKAEALRVIGQVKDKLEKSGYTIPLSMTAEPGQLPLNDLLQAILMLLGALGLLSLFLSVFLIVNTASALVTQQIRQIGIMKAVGARGGQIVFMYLALALVYGLLALALAAPLGIVGARTLSGLMAGFFNFDLTQFYVPLQAVVLQVVIGVIVPVLAALYPVLSVLRVTAADAISNYGMSKDVYGTGWIDRLLTTRSELTLRVLSRPLMLSLRNTFRRKGRLALTLITLTLAGAIFVGVFSLRASLSQTLDDMMEIYQVDLMVNLGRPQRVEQLERKAQEVDGVALAKSWFSLPVRRVRADGSESENIYLFAPPVQYDLVLPAMTEGRWLLPDDERALVVSTAMLKNEPDLKLGDEVLLKVDGRKVTFRIVGVTLGLPFISQVFASYADIARITQDVGESSSLIVVTDQHDATSQAQAATALEAHFKASGSRVNSVVMMREEMQEAEMSFAAVVALALVMALLLAVVGGLGLMGTLSINVLERTREIGVMRAIGAADSAVAWVFIVEGILIGLISWLAGSLCAVPLSRLLSDALGVALLQWPLAHTFSAQGVWLWLVVVVILSALASFLPARNASRLTVRDVLAYE
jgi:putative ABC transport system permease protein